jgi:ankyrin repeat protein
MDPAWERAVTHGDLEGVVEMLGNGADPNARNRHNQTALTLAAHRGHERIVEALLLAGANLNATAKYNLSAAMLAVVAGHESIALRLIRAGADVGLRGTGAPGFAGKTVFDLARERDMQAVSTAEKPGGGA